MEWEKLTNQIDHDLEGEFFDFNKVFIFSITGPKIQYGTRNAAKKIISQKPINTMPVNAKKPKY